MLVALSGCHVELPTKAAVVEPAPRELRSHGLIEIEVSGVGSPAMSARAGPVRAQEGPLFSLGAVGESGRSGIQLRSVSSGTFVVGARGNPTSRRYLFVTFEVRNASSSGIAYSTPRNNLTFVAVSTPSTISGTPIREILRFDGSPAPTTQAEQWTPTGAAYLSFSSDISALSPDVLQVFTEEEVAAIPLPPGVTAFPYGFMTRHATATDTRTLAANPAADLYEGYVTFAFKVPLGATTAEDPYTVRLMVVAVDDGQTRVTQSVEERDAPSQAAFEARVADLSATQVTLLTGGSYSGSVPTLTLCGVRSSGTPAAPIAYVNGPC